MLKLIMLTSVLLYVSTDLIPMDGIIRKIAAVAIAACCIFMLFGS